MSEKEFIKSEILRLSIIQQNYTGLEQGYKIFLNSQYGAIASPFFVCFNTDVAEAITLQGQDLIKYSDIVLNRYFQEVWHLDAAVHEKLGITVQGQITHDLIIYCDTDSNFLHMGDVLDTVRGWDKSGEEFILAMNKERLGEYLRMCFQLYAKRFNCENIHNFELESISESAIWLAKKKYVLNPTWKHPGIFIKSLSKIKPKGIEIVQGSTPLFARKKVIELLKYILGHQGTFDYKEFVGMLKKAKEEFKLSPIEEISKGSSVGDYEKFIVEDTKTLTVASKCPVHVRAAGAYNLALNNSGLKTKYVLIKTGDKVKWYYTTDPNSNAFAYAPNAFPMEFAPPIDYEHQFSMVIVEPINRFLVAIGHPPLPGSLISVSALF